MTSRDGTVPVRRGGLPIRGLRVEVTRGPDLGRCASTETERLGIGSAEGNELRLTDATVSRYHVELRRQGDRIAVIDHGSTNGTQIGPVRFRAGTVEIGAGSELELGQTRVRVDDGAIVLVEHGPARVGELSGKTPAMRQLLASIERVAAAEVPVLLLGESGTGKELCARAIHERSSRAEQPLVTLDCGALSPSLFASEVFGHERGAFTGADRRHEGAVERAHGGTLFLDEIGELPADLQSALLGVLERRKFRRVGGKEEIEADVRIVSATHRDLRAEVNAGRFRLDLFYRLSVVILDVPPLRERRDDIPLLVEQFLREAGHRGSLDEVFSPDAMSSLLAHDFPGNVRELKNIVLGTLALGQSPALTAQAKTSTPGADLIEEHLDLSYRQARDAVVDAFERRYLTHLLERSGGNVRQAARDAKMNRSYLIELLKKHGLAKTR